MSKYFVNLDGELLPLIDVCKKKNISYNAVLGRKYRTNDSFEEILAYYEVHGVQKKIKHIIKERRFYLEWHNMMYRCYNSKHPSYKHYGGRGIKVCERWHEYDNFAEDMYDTYINHCNKYGEKNTTLNRIDCNKGYMLDNCEWDTWENQYNNKRNSHILPSGETLKDFCDRTGIVYGTIIRRINIYKMTLEEALKKPIRKYKKKNK